MAFLYAHSGAYYDAVDAAELAAEPPERDDRPRLTTEELMRALEEAERDVEGRTR